MNTTDQVFSSIQPAAALHELILTPVTNQTLIINDEEHNVYVSSIFYFPDRSALNISWSKQRWLHDSANSRNLEQLTGYVMNEGDLRIRCPKILIVKLGGYLYVNIAVFVVTHTRLG